jgi:hypothetical protein
MKSYQQDAAGEDGLSAPTHVAEQSAALLRHLCNVRMRGLERRVA